MLLRQLCTKRLAVLPPPTPPSPPPPPPPPLLLLLLLLCAAELLLCCCCCHIRVPLLRAPKKICCASRCQLIFPFFDTRFVFFGDVNAISAIRSSQTQSKRCRNEFRLFQVRRNYWLNDFYRKHSIIDESFRPKVATKLSLFSQLSAPIKSGV